MEEKGWLMPREEVRMHRNRAAVPRETSIGKKVVELVCPGRILQAVRTLRCPTCL
jgi:hypothetical protein